MQKIREFTKTNTVALGVTLAIIVAVSILYFSGVTNSGMNAVNTATIVYQNIHLKVAQNNEGALKVFALASPNALAKYKTTLGNSIPEENSMVIGAMEAEMMQKEKLFSAPGDIIENLFGISPTIEGVLALGNAPIDYLHFVSPSEFAALTGTEGKLFIVSPDTTTADTVYTLDFNTPLPGNLELAEGTLTEYASHTIVGKTYYPLIVGAEEARMMREEKEFTNLGDTLTDFGHTFIVVGILKKNGSLFDMAHLVPLTQEQIA